MPISGRLDSVQASELFQFLENNRRTATFIVHSADSRWNVYFKDGKIIWASSSKAGEQVGEALVQEGFLSEAQLQFALAETKFHHVMLTSYLISRQMVTEKQLEQASKALIQRIVYRTFDDSSDEYEIIDFVPPEVTGVTIGLSSKRLAITFYQDQSLSGAPGSITDRLREIIFKFKAGTIHDLNLTVLPDYALRIILKIKDPNIGSQDIAKMILVSPELSVRLLRVANSAYMGLRMEVQSLHQAIALLGFRKVSQLILSFSMLGLKMGFFFKALRRKIHEQSIKTAFIARDIAFVKGQDVEEMFLLGLLYRLGSILTLDILEKRLDKNELHRLESDGSVEDRVVCLGSMVLQQWSNVLNMPQALLTDIIQSTSYSRHSSMDIRYAILWESAYLARKITEESGDQILFNELEDTEFQNTLWIGKTEIEQLQELLKASLDVIRSILAEQ